MDSDTLQGFVFRALIWGISYYFIRRGLNPENKDIKKFRLDAIYGSIATFASAIMFWYVQKYIIPRI